MKNITINGKRFSVADNITIIEAARQNGISIPSLCYLEGVHSLVPGSASW
jgi:NADH dehydrogenase/NADH:ubiquinone oxidoreductase subunit G